MKVVFITTHEARTSVGGVEQHVANLSSALARRGIDVWVVVPRFGHARSSETREEHGVHIRELTYTTTLLPIFSWLDRNAGGGAKLAFGLFAKLKYNIVGRLLANDVMSLSPDLVHQHDFLAGLRSSAILAEHIPVVMTNHTGESLLLKRVAAGRWLLRHWLARFDFIIGPSRELTPDIPNAGYISNGVDLSFFSVPGTNRRNVARRKLGASAEQRIILCPRRWAPTKGILYFANAISALPTDVAGRCIFVFAGSGDDAYPAYRREVESALARAHGADIRIVGNLNPEQLRDVYDASDLTVIPSLLEATSLAALESLACGVPVLATNVGGMPDIICDGQNGWLVPAANTRALLTNIVLLVRSEEALADARAAARTSVEGRFDWDVVAGKVLAIYEHLMEGRESDEAK